MARERSRPALLSKHAPAHSAFTSHGWPQLCVHTESTAASENRCPVSSVCCANQGAGLGFGEVAHAQRLRRHVEGAAAAMTSPVLDRMR